MHLAALRYAQVKISDLLLERGFERLEVRHNEVVKDLFFYIPFVFETVERQKSK